MGTSQSSSGSPSGVPMVPPWVPTLPPLTPDVNDLIAGEDTTTELPAVEDGNIPAEGNATSETGDETALTANSINPLLAPLGRFNSARRSIGKFAQTGKTHYLYRSLGHFVRTGYGGAQIATRRMGGTVSTARSLYDTLSNFAAGQPAAPGSTLDPVLLGGASAREVMDAVIEAVRPVDGTQDAEAARASIRHALSELLTRFPEANLLQLSNEERSYAIERYVSNDVYYRFELDLGKVVQEKSPNATEGLSRLKQIKDYVKETVAAAFRRLREAGRSLTTGRINQVVSAALEDTFSVFEDYSK